MRLLPHERPRAWPRFTSPLRSTAVTARLGRVLGAAFGICFVTGLLSHYQYHPWTWLPEPASPVWLYRVTQGFHVITGIACIPLLLVKLWSVYPNLFRWPAVSSVQARPRALVGVRPRLVVIAAGRHRVPQHARLVRLAVALRPRAPLPRLRRHRVGPAAHRGQAAGHQVRPRREGRRRRRAERDALERQPRRAQQRRAGAAAPDPGADPAGSAPRDRCRCRRGRRDDGRPDADAAAAAGPAGAARHRAADRKACRSTGPLCRRVWSRRLRHPTGPWRSPVVRRTSSAAPRSRRWPPPRRSFRSPASRGGASARTGEASGCSTWWSAPAETPGRPSDWRRSRRGARTHSSTVEGPQLEHALLATHLNGERLSIDHGYPLRLIAPNRAGVLNTKWLRSLKVRP